MPCFTTRLCLSGDCCFICHCDPFTNFNARLVHIVLRHSLLRHWETSKQATHTSWLTSLKLFVQWSNPALSTSRQSRSSSRRPDVRPRPINRILDHRQKSSRHSVHQKTETHTHTLHQKRLNMTEPDLQWRHSYQITLFSSFRVVIKSRQMFNQIDQSQTTSTT